MYILNFFMRHLKDWQTYRHIVCCSQIISIIVFQILLLNVEKKLSVERPQVTYEERMITVVVCLDSLFGVWTGLSLSSILNQKVCVNEPCFLLLKRWVEKFENLPSKQLIISIHSQKYLFGLAEFLCRHSDVGQCSLLFLIFNNSETLGGNFSLICNQKFLDLLSRSIGAGIVNEDNVVVLVLLHENWVDVELVPISFCVVVTGHHNAERELIVLAYFILLLIVGALFICKWWAGI